MSTLATGERPRPPALSGQPLPSLPDSLSPLETAVWRTLVYVDVFDYPLTAGEIHRYLVETAATLADVKAVLANQRFTDRYLYRSGPFFALSGREKSISLRQQRAEIARQLWPVALHYGYLLANLPFSRMVAVTGSLAVDNTAADGDIDYLIVAANGRVWLNRAFAIAVVRLAARHGYTLCPNYILAERALNFPDHNLYIAHEVTQMIPLSGLPVYQRIRHENSWTYTFLPNAAGPPRTVANGRTPYNHLRRLAEIPLRTPLGHWLDQWEMQRKIRKFQLYTPNPETDFSADWCKGHFDAHKQYTLTAYQDRLRSRP